MMNFNQLAKEINAEAHTKGWYEDQRTFGDVIALCHSELSEALEEYRSGHSFTEVYMASDKPDKPEGIPIELADCLIRILDFAAEAGIDLDQAVATKIAFNKTRPHNHGGKVI